MLKPLNCAPTTARLPWHPLRVVELPTDEADEVRVRLAEQDELGGVEAHTDSLVSAEPPSEPKPSPGIGHNNPPATALQPPRTDKDARREYFVAEIRDWIANRRQRQTDYMRPEEIGAAADRPFLLMRALLDGVASCYREDIGADHLDKHGRIDRRGADLAVGVFVVHTIFSDTRKGYSSTTAPRIAKLLGCSEKSVLRANELLAQNRVLCREKRPGLEDRYWPVINRRLAGEGTSTTWWLDATSDGIRRGRPSGKVQTAAVQSFSKPATAVVQPFSGFVKPQTEEKPQTARVQALGKTPDPKPENAGPLGSDDFTRDFTKKYLSSSSLEPSSEEKAQLQIDDDGIQGPGFRLGFAAIDLTASLCGMPKERARGIAEICARDWLTNSKKPSSPMAIVKRAIVSDFNEGQVQEVRLEAAKAAGKPRPRTLSRWGK